MRFAAFHCEIQFTQTQFTFSEHKIYCFVITRKPGIWSHVPLHRLECSCSKTMSMTGLDCYVKENYMHSRERVTTFTMMTSKNTRAPLPEFVFKGKGQRVKLVPPPGIHFQWSDSGSYRVEHVKQTIKNLPTAVGPMESLMKSGHKKYRIFTLDDYSAHLDPSIAQDLFKKGYILIVIGGGITGDMQPNDTALHHRLKLIYREKEQSLLTQKLRDAPEKVPSMSRNDIMTIMTIMSETWEECGQRDHEAAFKSN